MEKRIIEPIFFVSLLFGTILVVFLLFRPFLYTLVLAAIIAYLTHGVFLRLSRAIRSPSWAAAVMMVLVLVALLVPLTIIGLRVAYEAGSLYATLSHRASQEQFSEGIAWLQSRVDILLPGVQVDGAQIAERLGSALNVIVGSIGSLLGSFASLALRLFLLLLFYYYLVRDGDRMVARLKDLSPLSSAREDEVLFRIGRAITATVRGSLVMALLQGLVSGVGYIIFGLPSPALWGSVVVFAAFIPTVGTALVQIPAVLFLAATGHVPEAVGLAIWASLAVGMLDNILGPKLVARGLRMHPLVTLLAILGGIGFYGPLGILLGPITVALLYALLDIYTAIVRAPSHAPAVIHRASRGV